MKTSLIKALIASLVLWGSLAHADSVTTGGTRIIENPISNGNMNLRVNVGGTRRDSVTITGSTGAVTLGHASNTLQHTARGVWAIGTFPLYIGSGGSAGSTIGYNLRPTGLSSFAKDSADTAGLFGLTNATGGFDFWSDTTTAAGTGLTLGSGNINKTATSTGPGAWTFGPATGPASGMSHKFQSLGTTTLTVASATGNEAEVKFDINGTVNHRISMQTTNLRFMDGGSNINMAIDTNGALTLGRSGATSSHIVNARSLKLVSTLNGTGNSASTSYQFGGSIAIGASPGTGTWGMPDGMTTFAGNIELVCLRNGNGAVQTARMYHVASFSGASPAPAIVSSLDSSSALSFTLTKSGSTFTVTNNDASAITCFYYGYVTSAG